MKKHVKQLGKISWLGFNKINLGFMIKWRGWLIKMLVKNVDSAIKIKLFVKIWSKLEHQMSQWQGLWDAMLAIRPGGTD